MEIGSRDCPNDKCHIRRHCRIPRKTIRLSHDDPSPILPLSVFAPLDPLPSRNGCMAHSRRGGIAHHVTFRTARIVADNQSVSSAAECHSLVYHCPKLAPVQRCSNSFTFRRSYGKARGFFVEPATRGATKLTVMRNNARRLFELLRLFDCHMEYVTRNRVSW